MLLVIAATPALLAAQERTFALGTPLLTFSEPFTQVAGLAELPDGRTVAVDGRERVVRLVDRAGTGSTPLGVQGEGPLEYQAPWGVYHAPGDSLILYDAGRSGHYIVISPSGTLAREFTAHPTFIMRGGMGPPHGVDSQGRIYWLGDVVAMLPTGAKRNQTQNVRRWTPPAERIDTVAVISDHAPEMHTFRYFPFAQRDAVVIAKDGRVGVLSARDYRLRWYREGKLVSEGPALEHRPIPVTAADRVAFRLARAQTTAGGIRMTGPPPAGVAPSAAARRSMEEAYPDASFPATKPPFVEYGARISLQEDIWVTRTGAKASDAVRIDVLAPSGARRGHLLLPAGRRLVALERGAVYLARTDDDGFEWIERYAWPAGLR